MKETKKYTIMNILNKLIFLNCNKLFFINVDSYLTI